MIKSKKCIKEHLIKMAPNEKELEMYQKELECYTKIINQFLKEVGKNPSAMEIWKDKMIIELMNLLKKTKEKNMVKNALIVVLSLFKDKPLDILSNTGDNIKTLSNKENKEGTLKLKDIKDILKQEFKDSIEEYQKLFSMGKNFQDILYRFLEKFDDINNIIFSPRPNNSNEKKDM